MALFQRRKKRWLQQVEEMGRGWWPKVPETYPDGTPFPAREPYEGVLAAAMKITQQGYPEEVGIFCLKVLAHYASLTEVPFVKTSFLGIEVPEARRQLLLADMSREERVLSDAMVLAFDFHEKAGHRIVQNVDAEGNLIDVDEAGNLLDQYGNTLATDELGRPVRPEG